VTWRGIVGTWRLIREWSYLLTLRGLIVLIQRCSQVALRLDLAVSPRALGFWHICAPLDTVLLPSACIRTCDMTRLYCDTTPSYATCHIHTWNAAFIRALLDVELLPSALISMCDVSRSYVTRRSHTWRDAFICALLDAVLLASARICVCDMTHSFVTSRMLAGRDALICDALICALHNALWPSNMQVDPLNY